MPEEVVRRGSRGRSEAQRDREMLEWIARFRFVTAEVLSERFAVSTQSINARLRRLEDAGVIAMHRSEPTQPRAVFITGPGARRLGLRVRRAPRPDAQREQRAREADGAGRYSVDVRPPRPGEIRRWPDLVIEATDHRVAIEIEFATKAPERLRRIIAGYAAAPHYDEIRFFVTSAPLAVRIAGLAQRSAPRTALADMLDLPGPVIEVAPWPGVRPDERRRIETARARAPT